ncbi:hypothetical protein KA057_04130 [Candidatus Gracilibacteria bacterium]|jgi:hypothetical protein|nr:hypothetical protein [Candidatus Gracilibacteria bacterium]
MFEKLRVLSEVIMNDPNALKRFEGLPIETQKKYAIRTFAVVGFALALFSVWAILNMKRPKPVRVERAEIYDPQGEVVTYLQGMKISLVDVQNFLDNDVRGQRLQETFMYEGRTLKLSEMDPILLQKLLHYMNSVGILSEIARDKNVPRAIPMAQPKGEI